MPDYDDALVEAVAKAIATDAYERLGRPALYTDEKYIGRLEIAGIDVHHLARAAIAAVLEWQGKERKHELTKEMEEFVSRYAKMRYAE